MGQTWCFGPLEVDNTVVVVVVVAVVVVDSIGCNRTAGVAVGPDNTDRKVVGRSIAGNTDRMVMMVVVQFLFAEDQNTLVVVHSSTVDIVVADSTGRIVVVVGVGIGDASQYFHHSKSLLRSWPVEALVVVDVAL